MLYQKQAKTSKKLNAITSTLSIVSEKGKENLDEIEDELYKHQL